MNKVEPIRDIKKINEIKSYLLEKSDRDYFLFVLGINAGPRISEILPFTVNDVTADRLSIYESKNDNNLRIYVNPQLRKVINWYIEGKQPEDLLFPSRKGKGSRPITRVQAYNILNDAARAVGLQDNIGTHTLRKTFGYWHYKNYKDVALLQKIFGHSSPSITLRYIGIEQDEIDASMSKFFL